MNYGRAAARALLVAAAVAALASCGGDDDDAPYTGSDIDLASADTLLTVTFAPGDLQPGFPNSLASGDFNADGATDLLLGAPFADGPDDARPEAGEAYVLFGPVDGELDLSKDRPDVLILGAVSGDNLGGGVASGDLNGDEIDDIILGAPNSNSLANLRTDMGEAYVIFGRSDLPSTIDTLAEEQDFDLIPAEGFSHLGLTFAAGDVNGDGIDDLVAGAPYAGRDPGSPVGAPRTTWGEVYVVYGSNDLSGQATVAEDDQDVLIAGSAAFDQVGASIALADTDADGILDIIIGASGYDGPDGDRGDAGAAFVFRGRADFPARMTLQDADTTILGADDGDAAGTLVAAMPSANDGVAVAVGVPGVAGPAADRNGAGALAVADLSSGETAIGLADAGVRRIYGAAAGDFTPSGLATSEGLVALSSSANGQGDDTGAGAVFLLTLPLDADADLADAAASRAIRGAAAGDGAGTALAFADVDGDGTDELLVQAGGAPNTTGADPNYSAHLYVIRLD